MREAGDQALLAHLDNVSAMFRGSFYAHDVGNEIDNILLADTLVLDPRILRIDSRSPDTRPFGLPMSVLAAW